MMNALFKNQNKDKLDTFKPCEKYPNSPAKSYKSIWLNGWMTIITLPKLFSNLHEKILNNDVCDTLIFNTKSYKSIYIVKSVNDLFSLICLLQVFFLINPVLKIQYALLDVQSEINLVPI